jgi:1-acyl-sn-glycerol-3-phosphate acyltransferase
MSPDAPRYRISPLGIAYLTSRIFTSLPRRSLLQDVRWLLTAFPQPPTVEGIENVPPDGMAILCANHYQRPGLWIGWVGGIIAEAMARIKPAPVPVRIVVTDSQRVHWFGRDMVMPMSRWFLGRIAHAWGMIPIPADDADTGGRANTLRLALRAMQNGEPVLFFPEGEFGRADALGEALPGTGTFIGLASRRGAVIPCAVWESETGLNVRFGARLMLDGGTDAAIRAQVMHAIAAMVPERMRGRYG